MSTEMALLNLGAPPKAALALENTCIHWGMVLPIHKAHFLAQVAVESGGFNVTKESLNYSVAGLLATFSRARISTIDADRYGRKGGRKANQEAIANRVYGGAWGKKNLGNEVPGDGWRYIGRGYIQLTGLANYRRYSRSMYGDDRIVHNPQILQDLPDAALSAGWYWTWKNLNALAEADDIVAITKKVNGGSHGLAERRDWLEAFKHEFSKTY